MNTELLLKEFHKIKTLEERARHFYDHYIDQVDDEEIKKQLVSIRDDEIEHIKIAEALIECVS
jgi:rubrerythrin